MPSSRRTSFLRFVEITPERRACRLVAPIVHSHMPAPHRIRGRSAQPHGRDSFLPGIGHIGMTVAPAGIAAVRKSFLHLTAPQPPNCPRPLMAAAASRPEEFHLQALLGRVEDWRAGVGRSLCSLLARPFVCECHTISTMPRFQPPPRRTQHADFLALRSPVCFSSRLMGPSCWGDFRHRSPNLVAVEQPQGFV